MALHFIYEKEAVKDLKLSNVIVYTKFPRILLCFMICETTKELRKIDYSGEEYR